MRLLPSRL